MVAHSAPRHRFPLILAAACSALLAAGPPQPPALGPGHTLTPRVRFTDALGQSHARMVHRYQGLRVWGAEVLLHDGPSRSAAASPVPLGGPIDLDLTPTVPLEQAQSATRPDFATPVAFTRSELVIYPRFIDLPVGADGRRALDATRVHRHLAGYALAYLIRTEAAPAGPAAEAWDCLVDAHTGKLLERMPAQQAASTPALGVGRSLYSGTVGLNTSFDGTQFLLLDTSRGHGGAFGGNAVLDLNHNSAGTPALIASPDNVWGDGSAPGALAPTGSASGQTVAVDAAYGLQATWDYYRQVHGRDGFDGLGRQASVVVNAGGRQGDTDNAFWDDDSYRLTILDGSEWRPMNNLTVMAHEFTHAVTAASAGLIYGRSESGGLNEATSDIFGVMADTYARGHGPAGVIPETGANWIFPVYPNSPPGQLKALRYLDRPSRDGSSRDAWEPGIGALDMHFSSGPMNRAFYFLSQGASADPASAGFSPLLPGGMAGIGNDAAARIWYRALTTYLTPASGYKEARTAALLAARELFPPDPSGRASAATLAVRRAFGAIRVGDPEAAEDVFEPPSVSAVVAPSGPATPSGTPLAFSATVGAGVTEVDYFVDRILVAAAFKPPFDVPRFDAAHLLANGGHVLTASAFDAYANAGTSLEVPFTVANPVQQVLSDPGFEDGGGAWQGDPERVVRTDYSGAVAHGGYRYARFDREAGRQRLSLSRQVALPAGSSALLSLWLRVQGNPALAPDTLRLQLRPAGADAPVTLAAWTSAQDRADWLRSDFDLTCSAGAPQAQVRVSLDPAAFGPGPCSIDRFQGSGPVGPLYAQVTGSPGSADVTWSIIEGDRGGSLGPGAAPVYLPPDAPGIYHVRATSVADPSVGAQASIRVRGPITLVPASATLEAGATLPFTAVAPPSVHPLFSAGAGSFSRRPGTNTVDYTAPALPGTWVLQAQDPAGPEAGAVITVIAPVQVSVTPAALTLAPGSSCRLFAGVTGAGNTGVVWSLQDGAGGTLTPGTGDGPPVYTAPATPGTCVLVATSSANPARSARLTVTVQSGPIAINPGSPVVLTGGTVAFQAFAAGDPPVAWSVPPGAGAIDGAGIYTAPGAPGSYAVTASAGGASASVPVTVRTTNFSGDGKPFMNPADLAILAEAWGGGAGRAAAADLNGDGQVDDQDVALFFSQFGGLP